MGCRVTEDWAVLTEIKTTLAPFKFIPKEFEGRKPNLSDVVTHIFSLHRDLKHLHREYATTFERSGGFDSSIFLSRIIPGTSCLPLAVSGGLPQSLLQRALYTCRRPTGCMRQAITKPVVCARSSKNQQVGPHGREPPRPLSIYTKESASLDIDSSVCNQIVKPAQVTFSLLVPETVIVVYLLATPNHCSTVHLQLGSLSEVLNVGFITLSAEQ
ncbi:hypothetical protein QBC38DRAFT_176044 [Podospora fimiseda]|uniref:Uncharacterized protein n=1 Tax=Podospora fimiseda TaxID=252190 RepID=A0AAN6YKZ0_9PEZI|nr:hypothetical protein QBC38DRAFT_176044 [Podospora fimiseda]